MTDFIPDVSFVIAAYNAEETLARPIADQLAFGKITVAEAAQRLVDEGNAKLKLKKS